MSMLGRMFGFGRNEHYDKGLRLFDQGKFEEAVTELEQATEPGEDELTERLASFYMAESLSNLGLAALQKGDFVSAMKSLAGALAVNPHYADLHLHAGRAARGAGDVGAALTAFDAALSVNPNYAKAHFYRGLTLYDAQRPADALAALLAARTLETRYDTPAYAQALAAHEAGDFTASRSAFVAIAETNVDDVAFHAQLAQDLYRRGLYAESVQEFQRALAINGSYADLRNHLGIALNAQGLYPEAIETFQKALAINPKYIEARTNLALTLRAAGCPDEASAEFARVLEDDPTNAIARGGMVR